MRPAIAPPTTPPPGNNPRRPPGGRIPAGPDHARCRPPVSSRARWRRRPGQPARPARKIRRRHDPSRPVPEEADGQPDPPPPRSRGPRRARGLDAAPGQPRADPAATAGPFRPVEEPDNDDGRRVLPPPGRRGPGTAPPGAAAGPGYLHPPAHGPDGAVASSAADAAASHAHPDPRAKKTTAPSRNPFPTRASRSPALSRPIPARPSTVTASTPRPGRPPAIPRPGPRPPAPQDRTIRPPQPPARTPGTTPRTTRPLNPAPHPGTDTTQPHLDHFHPPPEKHQTLQSCSSGEGAVAGRFGLVRRVQGLGRGIVVGVAPRIPLRRPRRDRTGSARGGWPGTARRGRGGGSARSGRRPAVGAAGLPWSGRPGPGRCAGRWGPAGPRSGAGARRRVEAACTRSVNVRAEVMSAIRDSFGPGVVKCWSIRSAGCCSRGVVRAGPGGFARRVPCGPIMSRMGRSAVQRVTCRPVRAADGGAVECRAHLAGSRRRAVGLVDLCGPGLEGLVVHAPGRRRAGPGRVEGGRG